MGVFGCATVISVTCWGSRSGVAQICAANLTIVTWPELVDRALAQDLVDRFVAAGAVYVFTGRHVGLSGPRKVVGKLAHHDDHMHVRIR